MHTSDDFVRQLPMSYYSLPIYLDYFGYTFERHGESLIVSQDLVYPHEFPSVFLPAQPKNWEHCSITFATQIDIQKIREEKIQIHIERPIGCEFFYRTDDFVDPKGSLGKKVRSFQKKYSYKILSSYPREQIEAFHLHWLAQQKDTSLIFDSGELFYQFCLDHLDDYPIKQVYVEIAGKLVGFAWGTLHPNGGWVGLHLKVDYSYRGLSRFLHHERAKLFCDVSEFTLGTGVAEEGIEAYKRELGPSREVAYSYVLTGEVE